MHQVEEIKLLQKQKQLYIKFADGTEKTFSCAQLRANSPSAEMREHPFKGKPEHYEHVNITGIDPVGNYAVKLIFDDGHQTGIYSWDYFYSL